MFLNLKTHVLAFALWMFCLLVVIFCLSQETKATSYPIESVQNEEAYSHWHPHHDYR